jgi:hypothetical protein
MKCLALSSVAALLLIASGLASAGELAGSDIEIISVLPRSPDAKPIAMSVPADGHHDSAQFAGPQSDASLDSATGKLASEYGPKPVPSVNKPQR